MSADWANTCALLRRKIPGAGGSRCLDGLLSVTSNIPNVQHVENEKTFGLPIKRIRIPARAHTKLVPPPPRSPYGAFPRFSQTKARKICTGGIKRGVAEARRRSRQRPQAANLPGRTWEITALHTSTLRWRRPERIPRPLTLPPAPCSGAGHCLEPPAPKADTKERQKEGEK